MKAGLNKVSLIACLIVSLVFLQQRILRSDLGSGAALKVTTWDSFGYYAYLPGIFIFDDVTKLEWLPEIEKQYNLIGGELYQASLQENGNYVFKYLGGIAIMEAPWFALGHLVAKNSHFPADGFSAPYQYALAFGSIIYAILGLFILRSLLKKFFTDIDVALTVILMGLATNLIQYVSVDSAMSHSFIFFLYSVVLYGTNQWHVKPRIFWASLVGFVIGLATICRPTEVIMIFIPILWSTHSKEASKSKWALVKSNKNHVIAAILFGLIGVLPQLLYWKYASGNFIHNVGSKWVFLNPWFRVLFGWTNGWFIYTPVTVFFVAGFFFMKSQVFKKSVLVFCLLNIWIIISWFDWKYGATYSTRALVQSYPVFALPFASFISRVQKSQMRIPFYALGAYLIFVNFFQLDQYNKTILHYRDMNRQYYSRIYLNSNPNPLDMSLLDTDEIINPDSKTLTIATFKKSEMTGLVSGNSGRLLLMDTILPAPDKGRKSEWLRIKSNIKTSEGFYSSYLACSVQAGDSLKQNKIRLFSPLSSQEKLNQYEFYYSVPDLEGEKRLKISIQSESVFAGRVENLEVRYLLR